MVGCWKVCFGDTHGGNRWHEPIAEASEACHKRLGGDLSAVWHYIEPDIVGSGRGERETVGDCLIIFKLLGTCINPSCSGLHIACKTVARSYNWVHLNFKRNRVAGGDLMLRLGVQDFDWITNARVINSYGLLGGCGRGVDHANVLE